MHERRPVVWGVALSPIARLRRMGRRFYKTVRAEYWFPHAPLSLALAAGGAFLVWLAVRF
ncbi:MAG: hypothetical protein M1404_05495 [Acidobacteria bacterium]|nr:hypothetical protein [Acidobacteriota bacterium]